MFAWRCFFHITLTKPVKYLQAYSYFSSLFSLSCRYADIRCLKTWWKHGRFYWTIYTYVEKVAKYVRSALNNFVGISECWEAFPTNTPVKSSRFHFDITSIRRRPNFGEFPCHFHVLFRCDFVIKKSASFPRTFLK